MSNLMSPDMQIDKTLSVEGVAADAKAVGDALNSAKLVVKSQTYNITVGKFSQIAVDLPKDYKALLFVVCNSAVMWIQEIDNRSISFRCFGHISNIQLGDISNAAITFTLFYL